MELKNLPFIKNRNKLINIGLIILSLIIAQNIYISQVKKLETLKAEKDTELKKNALINDISGIDKKINSYKKVLSKRDASSIINSITQIASNSQVKITSVKPEEEKEYNSYSEIAVRLSIVAANYHRIGDFISRLENASQIYIIGNFSLRPLSQISRGRDSDTLSGDLTVIAVIFKG